MLQLTKMLSCWYINFRLKVGELRNDIMKFENNLKVGSKIVISTKVPKPLLDQHFLQGIMFLL